MNFGPAGGGRRRKKKSAAHESKHDANGAGKNGSPPQSKIIETEVASSEPVGTVERTRRLVLAAVRVWELNGDFAISSSLLSFSTISRFLTILFWGPNPGSYRFNAL